MSWNLLITTRNWKDWQGSTLGNHIINCVLERLILNKILTVILFAICVLKKAGLNFILLAVAEVGRNLVGFGRKKASEFAARSGLRNVLGELSTKFLFLVIFECASRLNLRLFRLISSLTRSGCHNLVRRNN